MNTMRILFLSPTGSVGGAERVLLTAIAGVRQEWPTADVRLICLSDGPLPMDARDLGAEAEILLMPRGADEIAPRPEASERGLRLVQSVAQFPWISVFAKQLRARIRELSPDLVHSNRVTTHLLSRLTVPTRVPVVWHVHDFYGRQSGTSWLLRRMWARARVAIAASQAVAADVRKVLPGLRAEVILNALDLTHYSPGPGAGAELDERAGLPEAPPGTVRVGLLATAARWKGHLVVLDAAAMLAAIAPNLPVRWYLVSGATEYAEDHFTDSELRAEVEARGLANRVALLEFTQHTVPVYRALDVVLQTSTRPEPFGLTIAEAMACGRALVVSAAGGAAELFTDGVDGIGVEPGNVDQLAATVRRLVEDAKLRHQLGLAARQTAESRFDDRKYGARLCEVYHSILTHRMGA